jgi:hypothetical protein
VRSLRGSQAKPKPSRSVAAAMSFENPLGNVATGCLPSTAIPNGTVQNQLRIFQQ